METFTDMLINIAAGCGLHCSTCSLYIGTTEEPQRLELLSKRMNKTVEELSCTGCRSNKRSSYCQDCSFLKCLDEKNLDYCGQCSDYPCTELEKFKSERPHRNDLWADMQCLMEKGIEKWDKEVRKKYTCSSCGTLNSAYDIACRKCKTAPSSEFVKKYQNEIIAAIKR